VGCDTSRAGWAGTRVVKAGAFVISSAFDLIRFFFLEPSGRGFDSDFFFKNALSSK
jgi:hypothetical protein